MTDDPCRVLTRTGDDGARLQGCPHGGHLTGWWPAGASDSRLWLSPASTCGPGRAIRGGIPVVFPQFGLLGPLPQHGFARDHAWTLLDRTPRPEAALTFTTTVGERAQWPHRAALTLSAVARGAGLTVRLDVANAGATPLSFTAALHTYLHVTSTDAAGVEGLPGGRLCTVGPFDQMFHDVPGPLTLHDDGPPPLRIDAEGFTDWVAWNPGPGHGLADVREGDETSFVCVEPAALSPVHLPPGGVWSSSLTLTTGTPAAAQMPHTEAP